MSDDLLPTCRNKHGTGQRGEMRYPKTKPLDLDIELHRGHLFLQVDHAAVGPAVAHVAMRTIRGPTARQRWLSAALHLNPGCTGGDRYLLCLGTIAHLALPVLQRVPVAAVAVLAMWRPRVLLTAGGVAVPHVPRDGILHVVRLGGVALQRVRTGPGQRGGQRVGDVI